MNLVIIAGSLERTVALKVGKVEIMINDVDWEQILDDIGIEKVMEHFDLVKARF